LQGITALTMGQRCGCASSEEDGAERHGESSSAKAEMKLQYADDDSEEGFFTVPPEFAQHVPAEACPEGAQLHQVAAAGVELATPPTMVQQEPAPWAMTSSAVMPAERESTPAPVPPLAPPASDSDAARREQLANTGSAPGVPGEAALLPGGGQAGSSGAVGATRTPPEVAESPDPDTGKLELLAGMGFSMEQAREALRDSGGDVEQAAVRLSMGDTPGAGGTGSAPSDPDAAKVAQLTGMGFPEDRARQALRDSEGDLDQATMMLLSDV